MDLVIEHLRQSCALVLCPGVVWDSFGQWPGVEAVRRALIAGVASSDYFSQFDLAVNCVGGDRLRLLSAGVAGHRLVSVFSINQLFLLSAGCAVVINYYPLAQCNVRLPGLGSELRDPANRWYSLARGVPLRTSLFLFLGSL